MIELTYAERFHNILYSNLARLEADLGFLEQTTHGAIFFETTTPTGPMTEKLKLADYKPTPFTVSSLSQAIRHYLKNSPVASKENDNVADDE